jgi:hypothetical protein
MVTALCFLLVNSSEGVNSKLREVRRGVRRSICGTFVNIHSILVIPVRAEHHDGVVSTYTRSDAVRQGTTLMTAVSCLP